MARLIYSAITSLDGYVADAEGTFEWAAPDEEVHAFVNDVERPIGTARPERRRRREAGRAHIAAGEKSGKSRTRRPVLTT